jgi:hypothetical protein
MKEYFWLAIGMLLLLSGLVSIVLIAKSEQQPTRGKKLLGTYVILLVSALIMATLLSAARFIESWISVDAYGVLFDGLTLTLLSALACGLALIIKRPRFIVSYVICACGAFLTFGEFLGR